MLKVSGLVLLASVIVCYPANSASIKTNVNVSPYLEISDFPSWEISILNNGTISDDGVKGSIYYNKGMDVSISTTPLTTTVSSVVYDMSSLFQFKESHGAVIYPGSLTKLHVPWILNGDNSLNGVYKIHLTAEYRTGTSWLSAPSGTYSCSVTLTASQTE